MSRERCELAGRGACGPGRVQWHHPIKQQRIRDRFPRGAWRPGEDHVLRSEHEDWEPIPRGYSVRDVSPGFETVTLTAILRDERNRMMLCSGPLSHHSEVEGDYRNLPERVWEFAREFGLLAMLENDIARQA